jgi:hypothetical protein
MTTLRFGHFLTVAALALAGGLHTGILAQQKPAPQPSAPAGPAKGEKIELTDGSRIRYRVREQLAGINFPSDAIGSTETLKGVLVIKADGSIDSAQSKLTLDLRTFKSDQERRDGYLQTRTLETEKFPLAEFTPKSAEGMPFPFPTAPPAQAGFMLSGDMAMHGVTAPLSWKVVATFVEGKVSGAATTSFTFPTFNLTKPTLARLLSVDDTIHLEIEFRAVRTAM